MRWLALILALGLVASPVRAQEADAEVDVGLVSDDADALLAFAEARLDAGDGGLAIEALERFLEAYPYDARVPEVASRLRALRKSRSVVSIESPHVEASVWIGGSRVAPRTPARIELPAGRHSLVVSARDGRVTVVELVLPPASRRSVEVSFQGDFDPLERQRFGAGGPLEVEEPEVEAPALDARKKKRRVVALAGTSSSALVLTGVFGMMALADREEFRREPSEKVARRGERMAILADVSFGVALVTGVTALVLRLQDREKKSKSPVAIAPAVERGGAGLILRGSL
ncbi:MAG: PEGA domain-containing protein [Myxococcales bacterium]|nr:PEGA domain-containing protein [Myxococcales bacterium]